MGQPRYQRRKEDRPQEITEAAFAAFSEKGFTATKVEEVARRAGVSKGLLYLYFKTKEELFKAVIRSVVTPRVDELTRTLDSSDLGAEAFIRGPLLAFMQRLLLGQRCIARARGAAAATRARRCERRVPAQRRQ
jgi:AcrR family transcriptional regulator